MIAVSRCGQLHCGPDPRLRSRNHHFWWRRHEERRRDTPLRAVVRRKTRLDALGQGQSPAAEVGNNAGILGAIPLLSEQA